MIREALQCVSSFLGARHKHQTKRSLTSRRTAFLSYAFVARGPVVPRLTLRHALDGDPDACSEHWASCQQIYIYIYIYYAASLWCSPAHFTSSYVLKAWSLISSVNASAWHCQQACPNCQLASWNIILKLMPTGHHPKGFDQLSGQLLAPQAARHLLG